MRKFTTTIILLIFFKFCYSQIVVINEILSLNNNTILDDFGDRSDWIELYNTSEDTVDLGSWYLSDDENNVLKWIFPDTSICPHGFILIFCSGRDTLSGYLHSSFKLKSSGEPVFLSDAYHNLVDYFLPVSLENDVSYGRKNDGSPDYAYFYKTSPGATNSNNILLNEISFSSNEGFYETNIQLSIFSQDTMGQIFYTINGNEPVPGDYSTFTYNEPISLLAIQSLPALYSYIQTSPTDIPGFFQWMEPEGEVERCVVIKARVFKDEQPLCNTLSGTYFIGDSIKQRFSLPVLSIIMDSIDLFSEDTGIYIPGKRYIPGQVKSGNYFEMGDAWERICSFTLFSTEGELLFKQKTGIEIQGNITRAAPNKSLEFTAKECYDGNEVLNYPFFPAYSYHNYRKVVTRSIFAAHQQSIVRDEIMQEIAKNLNVFYQEWQPVITFINGEYWGFQVLREKQDKYFLHQHYNIDPDSVDIIEAWGDVIEGDLVQHDSLNHFVETHDLSIPENYEWIKKKIDIPAYIDYYITETFIANRDWPGNNYSKWRPKEINSKWRWFLFDLDNGGIILNLNNLKRATGDTLDEIMPQWSTFMFKSILSNEEFKADFINRFVEVLNNDFHSDNTIPIVDKWEAIVEKEVGKTISRWHVIDSEENWHDRIEELRQFFLLRPCILKYQLEDYFEIDSLNINCGQSLVNNFLQQRIELYPNPSQSKIYINSPEIIRSWELYNLSGMSVERKYNCVTMYEEIDISKLNPGIYFLKLAIDEAQYQFKVIKTN